MPRSGAESIISHFLLQSWMEINVGGLRLITVHGDLHLAVSQYRLSFNKALQTRWVGGQALWINPPPIQTRTICRCTGRDNKSLWHNRRRVPSSRWGVPYGMNSISNDHPSAYYRCDYEPFVCFIKALNPRGFNESWDVKLSSSRMGRSQELLDVAWWVFFFFLTHSSLLFVSLHPKMLSELLMASAGMTMRVGFRKTNREKTVDEYNFWMSKH